MPFFRRRLSPLRDLADARGLLVGVAVNEAPLREDPAYRDLLAREFNVVTPENAMKFGRLSHERGHYHFEDADAIVGFAESHGMRVRGHTLVWHMLQPEWLTEGAFSRQEWLDILREHIFTVMTRYRGRVFAWDVVNEALAEDGSLRDTIWLRGAGEEYLEQAFRWAHEADPAALLFYNDYCADDLSPKSDSVYRLLRRLLERDVPIHGVGLQMHLELEKPPRPKQIGKNIARLSALGLQVHVTEMDVRMKTPATPAKLVSQARIYRRVLRACLRRGECQACVFWGLGDGHSWIPEFFPGEGAALLFDDLSRPKPACRAVQRTIR